MEGTNELIAVILLLVVSIIFALVSRRFFLGIGIVAWFFGIIYLINSVFARNPPTVRYNAEIQNYKLAVGKNEPFGDQYSDEFAGRKLIYWRWASYGWGDAIGVIYDPEDRLTNQQTADSLAGDAKAFHDTTHGSLSQIRKMEPHWYFVAHS